MTKTKRPNGSGSFPVGHDRGLDTSDHFCMDVGVLDLALGVLQRAPRFVGLGWPMS